MESIALFIMLLAMLVILVVVIALTTIFNWIIGKILYFERQNKKPIKRRKQSKLNK